MPLITTSSPLPRRKQKAVLRSLAEPFTIRDVSNQIAMALPHWLDQKAGALAEQAIREWRETGQITQAGTVDSLPAWRRAA